MPPTPLHSALIAHAPLLLDGAMGTIIQSYGQRIGNNDLLCLHRPDIIGDIHRRYLEAGADILTTNTFNAQRISLEDSGNAHLVEAINTAAVDIARQAIASYTAAHPDAQDRQIFIAASIGPTSKSLSMSPDINDPALRAITFDELVAAYAEQMTALLRAGVDAFLIETIFDTLNAKAAIFAADQAMRATGRDVPIMLSATVNDRAGRLLSGQTLEAFFISVAHARNLLSVGLNCSFGATDMLPHLRTLRQIVNHHNAHAPVPIYISAYPNAGLPNQMGEYEETPATMAQHIRPFLEEGLVDIVGGCCGTTDAHISALAALLKEVRTVSTPAQPAPDKASLRLSGLSPLLLTPEVAFVNVGERCNVAGSRKFLRLIKEKNYDEAVTIARRQVEDGALVLDINLDDGLLDTRYEMCHFLNLLAAEPDICRVPFMIDSSRWEVIRAALGCIQGKCIVNSISLKEGEEVFLEHAREIQRLGAAVIVMAFDEEGQATTFERRTSVCQRAYDLLTERLHFPPGDIIFDPNILAIATGMPEHDRYAINFIQATAWIKANLPGAHVSGGVSNLSFSFRGNNKLRESIHAVFLYHARLAGMDMAIVNPATAVTYADIPPKELTVIEDAVLARRADACERLTAMAERMAAEAEQAKAAEQPVSTATTGPGFCVSKSVEERLIEALRRGATDTLEADLHEALQTYPSPVAIIEGPLMQGMNLVGRLFGEGKMFLPQVVKTARTMKRAVEILQPAIEAQRTSVSTQAGASSPSAPSSPSSSPTILVATVKGDVHDIGKNIVATVMACNGYQVIDLGVMVAAETIVQQALETHPDVIGLSGLITPSLEEMVHVVHLLDQAGIRVPVMIGGATTSALHTALKIAPAYSGPVLHVCDASQNAPMAAPFLNPETSAEATEALKAEQASLRSKAIADEADNLLSIEEARAKKHNFF
ncbi:MAG: methionine synthase [Bacteroidales bacterium]|nr:methionine synthase [Bacteroidales bacterium]